MAKHKRTRRERFLDESDGYLMLGMRQHALESLDAIDDPQRAPFEIDFRRGMILRDAGDFRSALEAFDRAGLEKPDDVDLLLAKAWCFKRSNQLPKAIRATEHAHRVEPGNSLVLYNLACYWALAGNKVQALSCLGRALRMDKPLRELIADEADFDSLRDDPDFELLVSIADDTSKSV